VELPRFALAVALLLSACPLGQGESSNSKHSYELRLEQVTEGENVCVLLRRDGHYHFEHTLSDRARVYEGSISQASLKEIQTVVNNDELLRLTQSKIPLHLYSVSWDELDLRVARATGWQQLRFPDAESRKAFRQSLDPLVKWLHALPTENRIEMTEEEGKNNCLPSRSEKPKFATRERPARSTPVKAPLSLPDSYMLRIVFDQLSPGEAKRTCAIVYPNGFYHLEKSREKHSSSGVYQPDIVNQAVGGKIKADVFEQFLDSAATAELRELLDNPTLIASRHSTLPAGLHYTDAEITMLFIRREGMIQQLAFTNYFGGDDVRDPIGGSRGNIQHIDSAANLISPLQKWMKSNLESRKAARLKDGFGNNCTSVPSQVLPSEISSELAQVVPSDLDSTEPSQPIPTEARAAGSSTVPPPTITKEALDEHTTRNEPAISFRVTTRMVLLDVIATEKDGTPITDLRAGDISVLEDGRPQDVKLFSRASSDSARSEKNPAPQLPPDVYSNRPAYNQPTGPLVLLLLDGVNTASGDQAYARQQLLQYVRTLKADQRVAIFALTTDLFLLQDFTSDPAILRTALEKYSASESSLLTRGAPVEVTPQMASIMVFSRALENLIRFNQENAVNASDERVRVTLAALHSIARAMIGYPGRKNLIWVSAGFPVAIQLGGKPVGMSLSRNYADELALTAAQLSQARVAVYPVDARGLIANLQDTPGGPEESGAFTSQIVPSIQSPGSSFGAEELTRTAPLVRDSHIAMAEIAQDTGGRAFYDHNNLAAAVEAGVADGNSYYTLGYYPENKNWDGKFRKINLKAERKDIRLRYRSGYYAIDSLQLTGPADAQPEKTRVQELIRAIQDPLPATGVSFWAHLIPPGSADPSSYVEFLVDSNTLSCAAAGDRYDCNVDFAVFTVASNGSISNPVVKNAGISLPASTYATVRKRGLPFRLQVNSLPEHGSLRLAVRDNRTGLLGTLTIPVRPNSPQSGVNQ
jgi:VWFA-related protein